MKISKLLLIGLPLFALTSCEKDSLDDGGSDDSSGGTSTNTTKVTSIVVSTTDTTYTLTPTYDSQGRVTMIPNLLGNETYYAYSGYKKIVTYGWNTDADTLSIGGSGYPTFIRNNEGDESVLTYDSNGNIIEEYEEQADGDVIIDTYTWANGNCTKMVSNQDYGSSTSTLTYEYTYGTQEIKGPATEFIEFFLFVSGYPSYGKAPVNVITGGSSADYTYTVDTDGNITGLANDSYSVEFNF